MDTLELLLNEHRFRGRARRVRCFAHTLNLTAKATLRQFEKKKGMKKKRANNDNGEAPDFDDLPLLEPIAEDDGDSESDSDLPDLEEFAEMIDEGDEGEEGIEENDEEEIVNVFETLTEEEQERWKEEVKPLRSALQKVSRCCL
jgi:hypothetical protein